MLIPLSITSEINEINSTKFQAQIAIVGDPYQLGPIVRCKGIRHLYGELFQNTITIYHTIYILL